MKYITNGEYLNALFAKQLKIEAVPFNEAMIMGETHKEIFSDHFIDKRIISLKTTKVTYHQKIDALIAALKSDDELTLYFGADVFCQINLLTVLAYLDQQGYDKQVMVKIIDEDKVRQDEIEVIKCYTLNCTGFKHLYEQVLVNHNILKCSNELINLAIDKYLDYHSMNGKLAVLIKENQLLSKKELIRLILDNAHDYGITSFQAEELIERVIHPAK